ncbi:DUF6289 family protein [Pseudoxanthomonas mexicana]|uniref:DUF6289 family protein n=1 Tax=Pseudoxanthomonas mexicana TaxID=128785 RepID=UPI00398A9006
MKKRILFGILVAMAATSFSASGARKYSIQIDYVDEFGDTVGQYWAPCEGPASMVGVRTNNYVISQISCGCDNNPIGGPECGG